MSELPSSPFPPLMAELAKMEKSNLTAAIDNVESIIQELERVRAQIDGGKILPLPRSREGESERGEKP